MLEPCTKVLLAGLLFVIASPRPGLPADRVNKDAARLATFQSAVTQYVKLHDEARAGLPAARPTDSAEAVVGREHALADRIRALRPNAHHGDVFSPALSSEFRRLAKISSQGASGRHIQTSLAHSEPVHVPLHVNGDYPTSLPLQSSPPSLLENLPPLPRELEYRLVGRRLILRDVTANLIVDYVDAFIR